MEDIVDFRSEGTFQGQDYIIIVKAFNEQLNIHLESKYEPVWWNNTFTASYLEDLTQKTGIRRKFNEFVEAVVTGLAKRSETSNVDILTFQDLENMRNGTPTSSSQSGKNSSLASSSSSGLSSASKKSSNNKRYIIVTTEVNGEKVHYPLSLNLEDIDNVEILRQQIRKMKLEVEELKEKSIRGFSEMDGAQSSKGSFTTSKGVHIMPGGFFLTDNNTQNIGGLDRKNSTQNSLNTTQQSVVDQLKSENELLKTKIKRIEDSSSQKRGAVELDNIVKTKFELEEELEMTRKESQQTIERLKTSLEEKEEELIKNRQQFLNFQKEISNSQLLKGGPEADESTRRLREYIIKLTEETENEVLNSRKIIQKQNKELEKSLSDLDFLKQTDRKQKHRIKQLEIELESAIKRVSTKGTTDRLYSPYTKNTPGSAGSSASNRRATSVPAKGYSPATRTTPSSTTNANNNRIGSRNASNSAGTRTGISPSYQFNAKKQTPTTTSATQIQNRSPGVTGRYGSGSNTQGLNYRRNSPSGTQSTTNTNRYGANNTTNSATNIQSNSRNRYGGSGTGISGINGTATGSTNTAQRQFGTNKTNNTPSTNRLNNSSKGLSPKPNPVNANRQSPSNNRIGSNPTMQRTNSNTRLSPASRYNLTNNNNNKGGAYGINNTNRVSPGTRVNNYLSSNDQKLMKKIDEMQNSNSKGNNNNNSNIQSNNITKDYSDIKVDSNSNRIEEIDQRLNKLQNLLKMAKN